MATKAKKKADVRRVIPRRSILDLPAEWWKAEHPTGLAVDDPATFEFMRRWGVTHVGWASGRGKPKEIQTDDQAKGNHAWFRLERKLREEGREAELATAPSYPRHRASTLVMGSGGKGKPPLVINNGIVSEYVGIGWIELRPARPKDYLKIPRLTE